MFIDSRIAQFGPLALALAMLTAAPAWAASAAVTDPATTPAPLSPTPASPMPAGSSSAPSQAALVLRGTTTHHAHPHYHRRAAARQSMVEPLPAPVAVASGTTPAPVPNEAVTSPRADRPAPTANVAPSVFQLHYPPQGDGYVTGSSPQAMDDRNAAKATGVQVQVPLPQ